MKTHRLSLALVLILTVMFHFKGKFEMEMLESWVLSKNREEITKNNSFDEDFRLRETIFQLMLKRFLNELSLISHFLIITLFSFRYTCITSAFNTQSQPRWTSRGWLNHFSCKLTWRTHKPSHPHLQSRSLNSLSQLFFNFALKKCFNFWPFVNFLIHLHILSLFQTPWPKNQHFL